MKEYEEKRKIFRFILSFVTEYNDKYLLQMLHFDMYSNNDLEQCLSYIKERYKVDYLAEQSKTT